MNGRGLLKRIFTVLSEPPRIRLNAVGLEQLGDGGFLSRLACLQNSSYLLFFAVKTDVLCRQIRLVQKFCEGFVLTLLPLREIEVFIEYKYGAGLEPRLQKIKDNLGGGV